MNTTSGGRRLPARARTPLIKTWISQKSCRSQDSSWIRLDSETTMRCPRLVSMKIDPATCLGWAITIIALLGAKRRSFPTKSLKCRFLIRNWAPHSGASESKMEDFPSWTRLRKCRSGRGNPNFIRRPQLHVIFNVHKITRAMMITLNQEIKVI